jgi:hypothetical protein
MLHLELNLARTAEDMPDMTLALIRAIIAAADKDQGEMTMPGGIRTGGFPLNLAMTALMRSPSERPCHS